MLYRLPHAACMVSSSFTVKGDSMSAGSGAGASLLGAGRLRTALAIRMALRRRATSIFLSSFLSSSILSRKVSDSFSYPVWVKMAEKSERSSTPSFVICYTIKGWTLLESRTWCKPPSRVVVSTVATVWMAAMVREGLRERGGLFGVRDRTQFGGPASCEPWRDLLPVSSPLWSIFPCRE